MQAFLNASGQTLPWAVGKFISFGAGLLHMRKKAQKKEHREKRDSIGEFREGMLRPGLVD